MRNHYENKFLFSFKYNSFAQERFCIWPRFESESSWTSGMLYHNQSGIFSITQFNLKKLTRFFPNIGHHIFILVIESKTCTLNFTEFE